MLYYEEVFQSIQGEGADTGEICVFVRLFGCPFRCSYCDQQQTKDKRKKANIDDLLTQIRRLSLPFNQRKVCITGGEPLMQEECMTLVYELCGNDYDVSIETSGCIAIEDTYMSRKYRYIMDIKCPSSNMSQNNKYDNLMYLTSKDEVIFVIADEKDYLFAKKVIEKYPTSARKVFSPMFKDNEPVIGYDLVEWIKRDRLNARVQVQLHKILKVK